ncbi:hypothetical protein TVAG_015380 [Trichomonas vaginalis G3]|uniref:Baseplate structural protein Gp10 C-terminal domain-containing protein n=1 Tax=Trichomonas vaginalis (strain ATCC PRA-98 / G3) TaxID=412133 RepID=A2F6T8_TRIV3|nr:hypothetical protein TVAG_015380 [Trichomonas vaginalis G3]|eukprot:XP_001312285.1 hypothetical protein [Trichomonas vaginalis G3]
MSNETASMREIQHNRQLIVQALNKNTTNFSNYSKISESLKEGNLKLTINPMTDEFLFQDNKNHTVCINPTKGTLNEKPIDELLLKADVDNKADKEYVDATKDYILAWTERTYPQKHHTHNIYDVDELQEKLDGKADKTYVASVASVLVKKADKEYVNEKDNEIIERVDWYHERTMKTFKFKADTGWVSECLDLKADKTYVASELEKKADKTYVASELDKKADKTYVASELEKKADKTYVASELEKKADKTYVASELDKKADKTELQTLKTEILQTLYPIGSIYTSMNSTRPEVVLGFGTWTQIVDRFLYCANSSKETGGSKTISGENLPAHSHYIDLSTSQAGWHKHRYWDWSAMTKGKGYDVKDNVQFAIDCYWSNTEGGGNHTHRVSGYTQTTGQSKDYMPPYMTVYAWYRNA